MCISHYCNVIDSDLLTICSKQCQMICEFDQDSSGWTSGCRLLKTQAYNQQWWIYMCMWALSKNTWKQCEFGESESIRDPITVNFVQSKWHTLHVTNFDWLIHIDCKHNLFRMNQRKTKLKFYSLTHFCVNRCDWCILADNKKGTWTWVTQV